MTEDKFWMTLHKMGYQIKWKMSYIEVLKNETPLATIDRWCEASYALLKGGTEHLTDKVVMLIISLASTPIEERLLDIKWEMKND